MYFIWCHFAIFTLTMLYTSVNFAYMCPMVWICMHVHEVIFYQHLNILCIFWLINFCVLSFTGSRPVLIRFRFLGSTNSITGPVLITLGDTHTSRRHYLLLGLLDCLPSFIAHTRTHTIVPRKVYNTRFFPALEERNDLGG